MKEPVAGTQPPWFQLRAGPWDFIREPGPTGWHVREVPRDLLGSVKVRSEQDPSFNPWEELGRLAPQDDEGDVATYRAGASYWKACARLARIATGAATKSSDAVEAFYNGARDPWTWARNEDYWFGFKKGREMLESLTMSPEARTEYKTRLAAWERRKGNRSKADAEPKDEFEPVEVESDQLVRCWLAGIEGWPGFAWSSDVVGAAICGGFPGRPINGFWSVTTAENFSQAYLRLGLQKALPVAYHADTEHDGITLRLRDGTEIACLKPRKPAAVRGSP